MKTTRLIVIIVLSVLLVAGWGRTLFGGATEKEKAFNQHIENGDDYASRGLYQLAIQEYSAVVTEDGSTENWDKLLDLYKKRYAEDETILSDYLSAAESAVSAHPDNDSYITTLVDLCMIDDDYKTAYRNLEKAMSHDNISDTIRDLYLKVCYAYEMDWISYAEYQGYANGNYTVKENDNWKYIGNTGSEADYNRRDLVYAALVGEDGEHLINAGDRTELVDKNNVIHGFWDFIPAAAGILSEDMIAVCKDEAYAYYNTLGDLQFGNFAYAGAFQNGKAAVKEGEQWHLIDKTGAAVSGNVYADIKVNDAGQYLSDKVMVAKQDDAYHLYDQEEKMISDFAAQDMDRATEDGLIAFCKDGKWGYVDMSGSEVIAPQYPAAKSFSNGLAAVSDGNKWGFIDKDGRLVIDYAFADAGYFNADGGCMIKNEEQTWQLIIRKILK